MFKKIFLGQVLLGLLVLFSFPAWAAEKDVSLADFDGSWQLDVDKSKPLLKEAASKANDLKGLKFTVSAKDKTIRMEWPGNEAKTNKVKDSKGEGKLLSCDLEGYTEPMLMEKVSADEIHVKDRQETLVFTRLK